MNKEKIINQTAQDYWRRIVLPAERRLPNGWRHVIQHTTPTPRFGNVRETKLPSIMFDQELFL